MIYENEFIEINRRIYQIEIPIKNDTNSLEFNIFIENTIYSQDNTLYKVIVINQSTLNIGYIVGKKSQDTNLLNTIKM